MEQADRAMYHSKRAVRNAPPAKTAPSPDLDRTGLDDHTFQAIASLSERTYIYMCNMQTNVSRWSANAVESVGRPGEYMFDAGGIWAEHIHPEAREMYLADIDNLFSGRQKRDVVIPFMVRLAEDLKFMLFALLIGQAQNIGSKVHFVHGIPPF